MDNYAAGGMSEAIHDTLQRAIPNLQLRDIALLASRFDRPAVPEKDDHEAIQQHKCGVEYSIGEIDEGERVVRLFQVMVSLGTRIVSERENDEARIFFSIEADYVVEYEMTADIDQDALKAFADYNAVHNVWPFWRQHVFDIVSRARLPHMEIPLFSGGSS